MLVHHRTYEDEENLSQIVIVLVLLCVISLLYVHALGVPVVRWDVGHI